MATISKPIDIGSQEILHSIGYDSDFEPPARIASLVDDYLDNVNYIIVPSFSYVVRDIELVQGSRTVIEGSISFKSEVVARVMEHCQAVAVFVVTIGSYLEEMVSQLAEDGLMLQATVLDAIGSSAVQKLVDFVEHRISGLARARGLYTSRRFSPGYCDWDVSQQKLVFRAMNGDSAGVRLTRGCLMLPQKSVSGIIGIGPGSIEDYNPCKTCDRHDCPGRR